MLAKNFLLKKLAAPSVVRMTAKTQQRYFSVMARGNLVNGLKAAGVKHYIHNSGMDAK
jgi:hypothetical protein